MRMLMPSHAKNVNLYQEPEPLFTRHKIESQLNAMFSPYVTLRSGGYLVINQTEALVAVDVNSGKSTREFSIEETALNTNLEAADEIARQLKLRDLAGLIVIDFIDMEEKRNNRAVERRLKEALRLDRARIQVGRISHFGLLEMSRQRLRTGVLEGSTSQCPHCQGTGIIRSTESVALAVLRGLEDAITAGARTPLIATTTPSVALYILNNKRPFINDMEARHGLPITVTGSRQARRRQFHHREGRRARAAATPRRAHRRQHGLGLRRRGRRGRGRRQGAGAARASPRGHRGRCGRRRRQADGAAGAGAGGAAAGAVIGPRARASGMGTSSAIETASTATSMSDGDEERQRTSRRSTSRASSSRAQRRGAPRTAQPPARPPRRPARTRAQGGTGSESARSRRAARCQRFREGAVRLHRACRATRGPLRARAGARARRLRAERSERRPRAAQTARRGASTSLRPASYAARRLWKAPAEADGRIHRAG